MDYNEFYADAAQQIETENLRRQTTTETFAGEKAQAKENEKKKFLAEEFIVELLAGFEALKTLPGSKISGKLKFLENDPNGYYACLETNILDYAKRYETIYLGLDHAAGYCGDRWPLSFAWGAKGAQASLKNLLRFAVDDGKIDLQNVIGGKPTDGQKPVEKFTA